MPALEKKSILLPCTTVQPQASFVVVLVLLLGTTWLILQTDTMDRQAVVRKAGHRALAWQKKKESSLVCCAHFCM